MTPERKEKKWIHHQPRQPHLDLLRPTQAQNQENPLKQNQSCQYACFERSLKLVPEWKRKKPPKQKPPKQGTHHQPRQSPFGHHHRPKQTRLGTQQTAHLGTSHIAYGLSSRNPISARPGTKTTGNHHFFRCPPPGIGRFSTTKYFPRNATHHPPPANTPPRI